ncbi:MAG: DNA mismatch repair protein MutS, partial [Alicyclobacillus sp. RIFOXYA1_FULL_53_8]
LPFGGITDVRVSLQKAGIGGVLGIMELLALARFMEGGRNVRQAIEAKQVDLELEFLSMRGLLLFDARQTEQEIRQVISDDGVVYDHASAELRRIRSERRQAEARIRQVLEQMLRGMQKYLQDPVIAMRGNSFCLPVRVEFKNQIPGIVHDYSSSGATVFIEPQSVVELNHKVHELSLDEEREIERILQRLSGVVAHVADDLLTNAAVLADLDAISAKAHYARLERAERPRLRTDGVWRLKRARHPLIERDQAVPMDLTMGDSYRMIVITGPNTGGKTVTLKTVGLLTLLAMSGCFIPAFEGSEIAWCDEVFADIGDEQSIEQSLSTFSSHLRQVIRILAAVTPRSLVLLDELGAGTDPTEGAALAIAILDHLKAVGAGVIATTHYAELKGYAFTEPHAVNASVEFDVETLRPTYRLLVGVPGRSNALAIAQRLGLQQQVITKAQSLLETTDVRVEELISQLEAARKNAEDLRRQAETDMQSAARTRAQWETRWSMMESEAQKLREAARTQAEQVLETARTEATRVIQELRKRQQGMAVKDHELVDLRKALENAMPARPTNRSTSASSSRQAVQIGSIVQVRSLGQKGEVVEKTGDGKHVTVQLGVMRMKVNTRDVEVLQGAQPKDEAPISTRRGLSAGIPLELDIRGENVEDSLPRIDKYLDDAVMNRISRVTIIHGKGTGVLRNGVRRHLANHPHVRTWTSGGPGEGGDGATIVDVNG